MSDLAKQLQTALGSAYTLERELGGGGMSRVFLAEEMALGRKVVVKVMSPELAGGVNVPRFRREIQLAARLQQAQIVPVLAAGEIDGLPYYSMPFVDGESLQDRLANGGPLPIADVVSILRDVTRALAYAHEHGVVHRDIKPGNVLLSGGSAVVTDFGIAKALSASREESPDASLTQMGTSVGTPAYISPEQALGDPNIDHRSDLYSLGCMAYELLSGKPPFAGRTPQRTLAAHMTEKPVPIANLRPDVPPVLGDIVMRCMEKDPAARPQSAAEIIAALDSTTTSGSLSVPNVESRRMSTVRALLTYAATFAVVGVVAKASVVAFALPDWTFSGAILVMLLGLPVVLFTAYAQHRSQGASSRMTWRRTFRGGAAALAAFVGVVAVVMVLRLFGIGPAASLLAAGALNGRERLIVVDFDAGKDSSLSHVVTEAVRTDLGQSKAVSLMPPAAIAAALQRMQRSASTPVDLPLARDIAQREGVKAIVAGSVTQLGSGYVVAIRLVSADSGSELAGYRKTVNGTGELLDAIDGLTRKLRGRIGESLKAVRDTPALDQVTTTSLEALQKYAEATRAFDLTGDYPKAVELLRAAVAKDTMFAMAYRKLGVTLANLGMPRAQIDSALTRAYLFRDRLPEKERYLTIASYYAVGPGLDRQKAGEAYQQALNVDTSDMTAAVNLAGNLRNRREFARAESLYAAINSSSRVSQVSLANAAGTLLADGKVAKAESTYEDLRRKFPATPTSQSVPGLFLYLRGQYDSAEAFWRGRRADPNVIVKLGAISNLSNFALLRGRLNEAINFGAESRTLNATRGVPANPMTDSLTAAAIQIWYLEQPDKGVRTLDAVLAQVPMRSLPIEQRPYFSIATYYAWAGRPDRARAILAQYDAEVREPQFRRNLEPQRHGALAEIALAEKRPLDAVREFWAADSLPDGPATDCAHCTDLDLGRAFDLANKPDSVIMHWERYLAEPFTRGASRDAPYLAGIYKRLGEIYEAKNDLPKAASYYSRFLDLWKNADPALQPKVQDVKRRLAAIEAREKR